MGKLLKTQRQKDVFEEISKCGELIFACGKPGIAANIVGPFQIRRIEEKGEDRLDMGDGTCHVHVDWARVRELEVGEFHGEGMLIFKDGQEVLFRFYRPSGEFSQSILRLAGSLL